MLTRTAQGGADALTRPSDLAWLLRALPAGALAAHVRLPGFQHLDFIVASDAPARLYAPLAHALLEDHARRGGGG